LHGLISGAIVSVATKRFAKPKSEREAGCRMRVVLLILIIQRNDYFV
jgi:hypothetical protein